MLRIIFLKVQMVKQGYVIRKIFLRKMMSLIGVALTVLMISGAPAWSHDSSFPDNTVYVIHEFESGFHGEDPSGGWGANDQLFAVKETITFMADGTFTATTDYDDGVNRWIKDDLSGNNAFETTLTQEPGSGSGTYTVTADGVVTVTFTGDDGDQISGILSADGQTVIFGYSEFDNTEKSASLGIGVGVKRAATQKSILTAIYLLLTE